MEEGPPKPPSATEVAKFRRENARLLGRRMDRIPAAAAAAPRWALKAMAVVVLVTTFPWGFAPTSLLGIPLDTRLTLWMARLVGIALGIGALGAVWFGLRAIVAYLEEGRWPKKLPGGVEVDDYEQALERIEQDSEELSAGSDKARYFEKQLKKANETIRYQQVELERERGEEERPDEQAEERK